MSDSRREPDQPLRAALDELAGTVLTEHTIDSLLQRVVGLAREALDFVVEVSVTVEQAGSFRTVSSTGDLATMLDQEQYVAGAGPCVSAARDGIVSLVPDMASERRWPQFAAAASEAGVRCSMSVPLPAQQYAGAAMNSYSTQPDGLDDASVAAAQRFARYAGAALTNAHHFESSRLLAEQLGAAMQSRAVIDQAKGVLMAEYRCTGDQAFELLKTLSQNSNRKLRDVAKTLVDQASGQDSTEH